MSRRKTPFPSLILRQNINSFSSWSKNRFASKRFVKKFSGLSELRYNRSMMDVGGKKIDFKKVNRQRISILCANAENVTSMATFLSERGFTVEVSTTPSDYYAKLGEGAPGIALVSTQIDGMMAKMMPDFVNRRFGMPAILFQEDTSVPGQPDLTAMALNPGIFPMNGKDPVQLIHHIENLEEEYERRCKGLPPMPTPEAGKPETLTSEGVFEVLRSAFAPTQIVIKDDDVLTLHTCKVADPAGKGFFVFAFPVRNSETHLDQALLILETKIREVAGGDAQIEHFVKGVPAAFYRELMKNSDEIVTGMIGDCEMLLAYFKNRPEEREKVDEKFEVAGELSLVPMEEWWTRMPMPVHAYVWLQRNGKRILYVRPGHLLRKKSFDRFVQKGFMSMGIDTVDLETYKKIREIVHLSRAASDEEETEAA